MRRRTERQRVSARHLAEDDQAIDGDRDGRQQQRADGCLGHRGDVAERALVPQPRRNLLLDHGDGEDDEERLRMSGCSDASARYHSR